MIRETLLLHRLTIDIIFININHKSSVYFILALCGSNTKIASLTHDFKIEHELTHDFIVLLDVYIRTSV